VKTGPCLEGEYILEGLTSVIVGEGLVIKSVKVANDVFYVSVQNMHSTMVNRADILSVFSVFGSVKNISVSAEKKEAFVFFSDIASATEAATALDGSYVDIAGIKAGSNAVPLKVTYCGRKKTAGNFSKLLDSAVRLTWHKSSASAIISFRSGRAPSGGELKRMALQGRVFSCSPRQTPRGGKPTVLLGNIPPGVSMQEIIRHWKTNRQQDIVVIKFFPASYDERNIERLLRRILQPFGNLISVEVKQTSSSTTMNRALAIYDTRTEAQSAMNSLNERNVDVFCTRMYVESLFASVIPIHKTVFPHVRVQLSAYLDTRQATSRYTITSLNEYYMRLKVNCSDGMDLANISREITDMLSGQCMRDTLGGGERKPYWHNLFTSAAGTQLLNSICVQRNCYIYCDKCKKVLLYYASGDAHAMADDVLGDVKDKIAAYERDRITVQLSRDELVCLLAMDKEEALCLSGATSLSINAAKRSVVVNGPLSAVDKLAALLSPRQDDDVEGSPHRVNLKSEEEEGNAIVDIEKQDMLCVVCFCEYDAHEVISLSCCHHAYCKDCFANYLIHAKTNGEFPLLCVAEKCAYALDLDVLKGNVMDESEMHALVKASFQSYVNQNGDLFHWCPTPNCEQVYKVDTGVTVCDACAASICTHCKVAMHEGLSCEEYKEFRDLDPTEAAFIQWKRSNDVRACPKAGCGASIEKTGGCHHMTCSKCLSHICWVCMNIFKQGDIYSHMSNVHGGMGLENDGYAGIPDDIF
jgi:hypothetical protein